MSDVQALIDVVIQERKRRGWTRYRLSVNSGVSQAMIKYVEEGTKIPGILVLQKLYDALDLNLQSSPKESHDLS